MLDVIADFWKPIKRTQGQERLEPDQLQIGSAIGFGFVPQASLSGRRLGVSAINTYRFGDEALTSFVLSQEKDAGASMIVAESEGEQYLAISRRLSIGDRMKLFESADLENVMTKDDATRLPCKETLPDFRGWVVASYKREIQGMKGAFLKGDFRKKPLPANEGQEFAYTLLVSDSNEHAVEIEKYSDGRIEVYATVYRRMTDVGEITHPINETTRPDIKLASPPEKPAAAAPVEPKITEEKPAETTKVTPLRLQEFPQGAVQKPEPKPVAKAEAPLPKPVQPAQEKKPAMATVDINTAKQSAPEAAKPTKLFVQPTTPENYLKQEIKAVTSNGAMNNFDSETIECDLRVANKVIDEAIRNEMRLTDIVRRIIELPVAYQEQVQIPVTLSDEDYALLAIRYGIPAADRNSIKRRIIEDLNDFSGSNKKMAA